MNTEEFTYSEEELELLRENTYLGIISKLRINKRKLELFEYDLRVRKWIKSCESAWEKYREVEQDRYGLDEFSRKVLNHRKIKTKDK